MNSFDAILDHAAIGAWSPRSAAEDCARDFRWLTVETLIAVERILEDQPENEGLVMLKRWLDSQMRLLDLNMRQIADINTPDVGE